MKAPSPAFSAISTPVLEIRDLQTYFFTKRGVGKAVDGVSLVLGRGETLGLVGESGCGKSITCFSVMRLHPRPASRIVGGQILFHGEDLLRLSERQMQSYRGRDIAMIMQDPMSALNPVFTIGNQLGESLDLLRPRLPRRRVRERAVELLRLLQVPEPRERLVAFPHQFSGGMRQRVVGAIALARNPEVIIADEPTTALDVTVQAAYLALLKDLQRRLNVSIIFVTHDFGVVARMCDRVAVMYAGRVVEVATTTAIFERPIHPYSAALFASVPDVTRHVSRLYAIEGQPPSIYDPPEGCRFHPRCPLRAKLGNPTRCQTEVPELREAIPGRQVACHFAEESLQGAAPLSTR